MEMDVNRRTTRQQQQQEQAATNLMTISARCCGNNNASSATTTTTNTNTMTAPSGCCGILSRFFCVTLRRRSKPAHVAGSECNNTLLLQPTIYVTCGGMEAAKLQQQQQQQQQQLLQQLQRKTPTSARRRRTPQEIYFESRGKSCKKLLKFNGNSNKILLYPEEGWARTASSSYWTITPCWWQPNRCRIVECAGTQRHATKAKMLPLEQQGSLLIAGHFRRPAASGKDATTGKQSPHDEFKLYLTSNISMEDYNMGYCLTGFVERRCQQTNTFQMTHFAVIKRQWPPPSNLNDSKSSVG